VKDYKAFRAFAQSEERADTSRPCIISIGLDPSLSERERFNALFYLGQQFHSIAEDNGPNEASYLCAGPINQTYEEAFKKIQRRFFAAGWIYVDTL